MKASYDIEQWAAGTARGRHVFNYHYRMFGREIKGWTLLKAVPMQDTNEVSEKIYLWQNKKDPIREMVRISVAELEDWRHAQQQLLQALSHCMRSNIPQGTGKLATVGDVNFVSRETKSDIPAAISFTRGNVCVAVNSVGDVNIDVSKIAESLDKALSEPPTKGRAETRAKAISVKTGTGAQVVANLSKTASSDGWLKFIAPDGELRRKGDALMYIAPKVGGKKSIDMVQFISTAIKISIIVIKVINAARGGLESKSE